MPDPTRTADHLKCSVADTATTTTSSGATGLPASPLQPADRYLLGSEIARGGMGAVYRATDTVLNREVAIKVLQERFAPNSPTAARFFDEARITAQLQHPAIPPIHDLGTLPDGRPFLAMKLIHGQTLEALLNPVHQVDTRPSPNLVAIFEQICLALAFAHSRHIIHRDLKPANVMVGAFGEVQVMDWGLARETQNAKRETRNENPEPNLSSLPHSDFRTPHTDHTVAGSAIGTPAFMPPEQARGELELIDSRSDVFGLGAILCNILTGQPPYTKTGLAALRQAGNAELHDTFTRLDAAPAEPELIALCKHCLNPKPQDRPADAGLVAKAVSQLRTASEERARHAELERVKAETEAHAQQRRRRLQLALAAAAMLLIAAGGAFAWWQDKQKTAQARDAKERTERNAEALHALLTRCEHSLRQNNADDAAAALAEIERRLPEGGDGPLTERIQRSLSDLKLLCDLNVIDEFQWSPVKNVTPNNRMQSERWRVAFAGGGLNFETQPAADIVLRVKASALHERLIFEMDHWLLRDPQPGLREVLRSLDPNPYRESVRDAILAGNGGRVAELANQREALAQPPRFAALLGTPSYVPAARRREILEASLRANPGNLSLLMRLGQTYPLNQQEGATQRIRWFQAAVAAHPRQAAAHMALGIALADNQEHAASIDSLREALRLDPTFRTARLNLAGRLSLANQHDEAIAIYQDDLLAGSAQDAAQVWVHDHYAHALLRKGDFVAAREVIEGAIRLNPTRAELHLTRAEILRELRVLDEAVAACREALRHDPQLPGVHHILGTLLSDQGQLDEALAELEAEVRVNPTNERTHFNIAAILLQRMQLPEAIRHSRAAIAANPQLPEAYVQLGTALKLSGDLYGARRAYKKAGELDPRRFGLIGFTLPPVDVAPHPRERSN